MERLDERWAITQGVQTGADAYSTRIQKRLASEFPDAKAELDARGATPGAPILELPAGMERTEPWASSPDLLARSIEPTAILYAAMDEGKQTSLVWISRGDEVPESIRRALDPWRPVLENRAEIRRNSSRRWIETAWPRDKQQLRKPKVIALYRTDRGRFALDETGEWQPSIKTTLVIPKQEDSSVAYLCGLLNSELLDLWYGVRGKIPRDIWRNYEPKPMARIPYRHAEPMRGEPTAPIRALEAALVEGDPHAILAAAEALGGEPVDAAEVAWAIEILVRALAANRRALLPLRDLDPELGRTVKDPWRIGPVQIDQGAAIARMPAGELRSVRLDPELTLEASTDGVLGRPKLDGGELVFRHARKETARVTGQSVRLALLADLLASRTKLSAEDLSSCLLPKDMAAFEELLAGHKSEISMLLDLGRAMVEAVERLTCRIYGLSPELEEDVVASAISRAAGSE